MGRQIGRQRDEFWDEAATGVTRTIEPATSDSGPARTRPIDRVRGTHDRLAPELGRAGDLLHRLSGKAAAHGYQHVDTPVLEHTELFLRKSGGDRVAQLYAFDHRGRSLALRPEFTAPAVRLFIEHLQGEPLPVRLSFSGPVFRYEKPQSGRSRQFTEFCCELIGASGPVADAEIISLALDGLRSAGVERPRLVLGHIGIVINFLSGLDIDQRAQDWLTWSMERIRKGDDTAHDLPPHLKRLEASLDEPSVLPVDDEAIDAESIAAILRQAGVEFQGGTRTPEDIVRGLFAKRRRRYDAQVLRDAAGFVSDLTRLVGPPAEVMQPLRELVAAKGLNLQPLDELDEIIGLLAASGFDPVDIWIDLGMGRGLHYYTGMLFEIYAGSLDSPQLCGGGRYDDLAQVLGARQPVAACGFSYGLERVLAAVSPGADEAPPPKALVLQGDDAARALGLAADLRAAGWVASVDLRGRNLSATRRAALRQGYAALVRQAGAKVEVIALANEATVLFDSVPTPDEVVGA